MENKEYNGYRNRETWLTALWIDNDEGLAETVQEMARDASDESELEDSLENLLGEIIGEHKILTSPSFISDLFLSAFNNIEFRELAEMYFEEYH